MKGHVHIDIGFAVFVFEGGVLLDFLFYFGKDFSCRTHLRPANPSYL